MCCGLVRANSMCFRQGMQKFLIFLLCSHRYTDCRRKTHPAHRPNNHTVFQ